MYVIIFTPKNNFKGDDWITITTNDLGNTGVGGSQINTSKIPVTINPYTVSITANNATIDEGNSGQFTISRNGTVGDLPLTLTIDPSSTVTNVSGGTFPVDCTFSGGNVAIASSDRITVTIPDGKSSVDVTVIANKDSHAETNETLKLNIAQTDNYDIDATKNNFTLTIKGGGTVVTSTKDDVNLSNYAFVEGTLRQAIVNAALNWQAEDTITFNLPEASDKITLTGKLPRIQDSLKIDGLVNKVTIDGDNRYQIFDIYGTKATFNNLILINGKGDLTTSGGISAGKSEVTVSNSIFLNNTSMGRGAAIHNNDTNTMQVINSSFEHNFSLVLVGTGAISNSGNLILTNSTISNNSALGIAGGSGGISNDGTITINNSTIANNFTGNFGGGIANMGIITVNNSTIANNYAGRNGGGIYNIGNGKVTVSNTIIAENIDSGKSPDFHGTLESDGYNLIGNTDGITIIGDTTTNILDRSPKLDSLKDNGGLTQTMALLAGSPAINAGDPNFNDPNLLYDQRGAGFDRIFQNNRIDIGAFESKF